MISLETCNKIFIDFDGVLVDSNEFKEIAIEKSIFELFGKTEKSINAINYFNINAGIGRGKKLSVYFKEDEVKKIMKIYSEQCTNFFNTAIPTLGAKDFLEFVKKEYQKIKLYILSGGEQEEIKVFLKANFLYNFFEDILASNQSKYEHLKERGVAKNDIFIGDTFNDLKASREVGMKFILFEEYKSLKSFPNKFSNKKSLLRTKNFNSLMGLLDQ